MHIAQVLLFLLTLRFLGSGKLFRLKKIAEGKKDLASESVLRLGKPKRCATKQQLLCRNEALQIFLFILMSKVLL